MKALSATQRVTHDKYGLGVVSEADAEYTVIEFDEHGRKKFLTRLVTLQPSDEPPPKRRRARKKTTTKVKAADKTKEKAKK